MQKKHGKDMIFESHKHDMSFIHSNHHVDGIEVNHMKHNPQMLGF